jgi:heme O synthase-like polyprenyltransferase
MKDYLELTKPRITLLILVCTAVGYWFRCGTSFHWVILAHRAIRVVRLRSARPAANPTAERQRKRPILHSRRQAAS